MPLQSNRTLLGNMTRAYERVIDCVEDLISTLQHSNLDDSDFDELLRSFKAFVKTGSEKKDIIYHDTRDEISPENDRRDAVLNILFMVEDETEEAPRPRALRLHTAKNGVSFYTRGLPVISFANESGVPPLHRQHSQDGHNGDFVLAAAFSLATAKAIQDDLASFHLPETVAIPHAHGLILATARSVIDPESADLATRTVVREGDAVSIHESVDTWKPRVEIVFDHFIPHNKMSRHHTMLWRHLGQFFLREKDTAILGQLTDCYSLGGLEILSLDEKAAASTYLSRLTDFLKDQNWQVKTMMVVKEAARPILQ
jgi:hypothetical protein